jgi:DNA modification methylase
MAGEEAVTWEVVEGDCVEAMAGMEPASVDAVVCDPPYGLSFMGRAWDTFDPATLPERVGVREGTGPGSDSRDGRSKGRSASAFANPGGEAGAYDFSLTANQRFQAWCEVWAREAFRVLKPGGHMLVFGGTRTYHRLTSGIEDAGFEIRDSLLWLYGSGFPKSLNVSLAIDKAAGGEDRGRAIPTASTHLPNGRYADEKLTPNPVEEYEPQSEDAERWQGWGTALKPAHEPIVVARKPLAGTVVANVLEHGTGALNVDGCRVGTSGAMKGTTFEPGSEGQGRYGTGLHGNKHPVPIDAGRWPANVALSHTEDCVCVGERRVRGGNDPRRRDGTVNHEGSYGGGYSLAPSDHEGFADEDGLETVEAWECVPGCPVAELDAQSGTLTSGTAVGGLHRRSNKTANCYGHFVGERTEGDVTYGDTGGASRFFYCAKTSRAERNAGLDGFEERMPDNAVDRAAAREGREGTGRGRGSLSKPRANVHPTVKPISLMRWLVRLVTPPGGLVLDPFTGSGTTGCAAVLEGFRFIGIEREKDYLPIARARIAWWAEHPEGLPIEVALQSAARQREAAESGQLTLEPEPAPPRRRRKAAA